MSVAAASPSSNVLRRVVRLQVLTIVWMSVEAIVALATAWAAGSPALVGFGGDSVIELLSALVVFWRFRSDSPQAEKIVARIAGGLLFGVAATVMVASGLSLLGHHREPQPTLIGIGLLIVAAVFMPWLAAQKRTLATQLSSASLKADAAESSLCAYMSWIALAGLMGNAVFRKSWADPAAALLLIPFIVREGWEAIHTSRLCCPCASRD